MACHTNFVRRRAGGAVLTMFVAGLSRAEALSRLHPFKFGVAISAFKTGAADAMAQIWLEKRETLDRRRSAIFVAWGAFYLGGIQYFIYVHLFSRVLFPSAAAFVAKPLRERLADRAGQLTVIKQVALDQLLHHPFMLFPCFYCVKEAIEAGQLRASQFAAARGKYLANLREDCFVCWSTWVPAFLFNFSILPIHARVPFVAVVSFGFTTYFSFLRGKPQELADS